MSDQQAYPLAWPTGWIRTAPENRQPSQFGKGYGAKPTIAEGAQGVIRELERMGVPDWEIVISTNVRPRLDGLPRSGERQPDDPGAAVYFRLDDEPRVLACDRWTRVGCNLRAIAKHIVALRGMERWGVGSLEQAFRGYVALTDGSELQRWTGILEVPPEATPEEIIAAHRAKALEHHPDRGGDPDRMADINAARDEGLAWARRAQ